mmetsp:Transcript_32596/g.37334  ORF Transcript_32596/g.37334 Transcript_32596/m.37334 type:complete len:92 (+) Transcript_32596:1193-1468(+)
MLERFVKENFCSTSSTDDDNVDDNVDNDDDGILENNAVVVANNAVVFGTTNGETTCDCDGGSDYPAARVNTTLAANINTHPLIISLLRFEL